jgi:serine/threonine protein kinase
LFFYLNFFRSWGDVDSRHKLPDVPRFCTDSNHDSLQITDVLAPGVVYLGKGSQSEVPVWVVKVLYSGMAFERYGVAVHRHLESKDMAPKYINCYGPNLRIPHLDDNPIEFYHSMEYLPPPLNDSAGWMSLLDIEKRYRQIASIWKEKIREALYQITDVLKQAQFVHGDLRPNNLLISVKLTPDGCIIQLRPNSSLPYLKVIDFDWAGEAEKVEYPPHRNPEVEWPGKSGKPISVNDDRIMIDSWLSKWALANDTVADADRSGGDEVFLSTISCSPT